MSTEITQAVMAELAARDTSGVDYSDGPKFKADDTAKAAAEFRRSIGPVELAEVVARPERLSWSRLNDRDYSRLELADYARETRRMERAVRSAEAARKFRVAAVKRSAELVLADMPRAEVTAKAAKELAESEALAEAARDAGVTPEALAEELASLQLMLETPERPARGAADVGQLSAMSPEALAAVADWTTAGLTSEAAKAGRAALAAIGRTASAVVATSLGGQSVTVSLVRTVPDTARAAEAVQRLTAAYAEAAAKLAEAETKVAAAKAAKASAPIKAAEANADRVAAGVAKLAARLAKAEAAKAMADGIAGIPEAAGLIAVPLAAATLADVDAFSALEIPERTDRMPARYVERGPSARRTVRPVSDPTGSSAAALADGYRAALAKAEARAAKLAAGTSPAAADASKAEATEAKRVERRARQAAALRVKRRAAKQAAR